MLVDPFGRQITYLRLSLTDRCNLRCRYCMPHGMPNKLAHEEILTYEEFLAVVRGALSLGVKKVRLTGGEPLARKGLIDFIQKLNRLPGSPELCLTTNGVLLAEMAEDLKASGIQGVNVSLDSLDKSGFEQITGFDMFDRVWAGIEKAIDIGFDKVKINTVAIKGLNEDEFMDFARLTIDMPIEVRFIEYMPMQGTGNWTREKFIDSDEIKERISSLGELEPVTASDADGPSIKYRLKGARGRIGFISPISRHFCSDCNRIRLTADGKLRLCLHSNKEIDIKTAIRSSRGPDEIKTILKNAVLNKPQGHNLQSVLSSGGQVEGQASNRAMNLIGG